MTAGLLIELADALRPNQYTTQEKLGWLEILDGQIRRELLDTHEDCHPEEGEARRGDPFSSENGLPRAQSALAMTEEGAGPYSSSTELLVPAPWDEPLYTSALFCRIDLNNAEIGRYDQSAELFAAAWRQYADYLNRTRRPKGERRWKL